MSIPRGKALELVNPDNSLPRLFLLSDMQIFFCWLS